MRLIDPGNCFSMAFSMQPPENRQSKPALTWCVLSAIAMLGAWAQTASAQNRTPVAGGRSLADGVLHVIPSALNARDTFSQPAPMPELAAKEYAPKLMAPTSTLYGISRNVVFFREVWEYEFAFTGLRQATVNVPDALGNPTQNVWYMVYRVRNLGTSLSYEDVKKNPEFDHLSKDLRKNESKSPRNFLPRFTLEGWVYNDKTERYEEVAFRDEIIPSIAREIQRREDPKVPLFDAVQLSDAKLAAAPADKNPGIWGVAIWTDVNPKLDYVSVVADGFTNAYRIDRKGDEVSLKKKMIQLNFWRPGDAVKEAEDEIDFGIPLVDDPREQVLITRRYDLPGPLLKVYRYDQNNNKNILVAQEDARFNLEDLTSPLIPILDKGKLPTNLAETLGPLGLKVDKGTKVAPLIEGTKWKFEIDGQTYFIVLEYQFWEPTPSGMRFIKSLDSFWIYR